jgi:hypothetical protein
MILFTSLVKWKEVINTYNTLLRKEPPENYLFILYSPACVTVKNNRYQNLFTVDIVLMTSAVSVSVVTRIWTAKRRFGGKFLARTEIFLFTIFRLALGPTQIFIQWAPRALSLGREAYHSLQPSANIKNAWSYTSTFPYTIMA